MKRGTTPTHTFTIPFDVSMIKTAKVIYSQSGKVIFDKCGDDLKLSENTIQVKLNQEDTLSLDCKDSVSIQVRVLTVGGDALASDIMLVPVSRCLDDEVLV